jgi:Asp/Glu/hydantoin racemase
MKFLVVNIPAAEPESDDGDFIRSVLVPLWQRNFALSASDDVELTFRFAADGEVHPAFAECCYLPRLNAEAMLSAAAGAESEGYDAVVMTCFGDPALNTLREKLAIPAVSIGEAAMLTAAAMGYRFGIVAPSPFLIEPIREQVARYGLTERLAGVTATKETARQQEISLSDAEHAIAHFSDAGRELIAAGADVLIPGCGLLSPALRLAPGTEFENAGGFNAVDGVPIVDILSAALWQAQALARLQRAGSGWRNPNGFAAAPPDPDHSVVAGAANHRFWDV